MKKKYVAMLLVAAMLVSGTGTAYAAEYIETPSEDEALFEESDLSEEFYALDEDISDEILSDEAAENVDEISEGLDVISEDTDTISEEIDTITEDSDVISEDSADEEQLRLLEESETEATAAAGNSNAVDYIEVYTGYVPSENPIEITDLREASEIEFLEEVEYPKSYTTSLLPPLRSQSPYGTCWAHATLALAEINALKKGLATEVDFSELHLAYFNSNHVADPLGGLTGYSQKNLSSFLDGNNEESAMATLSGWMGLASEERYPYRSATYIQSEGLQDEAAYDDAMHVQGFIKEKATQNSIKKLVTEYGAVGIDYHTPNSYSPSYSTAEYNPDKAAFCNPTGGSLYPNHAVVIVGWDDDFSAGNFTCKPAGNGAWLVRNSWTQGNINTKGYAGYFWMSYYEPSMSYYVYALDVESADNYDNNYQYGLGGGYDANGGEAYATVFEAHAEGGAYGEKIEAVAFYTNNVGAEYSIEIYRNVTGDESLGTLCPEASVTGIAEYAGYKTVKLPTPVTVAKGEKFAIVMRGEHCPYGGGGARDGRGYIYKNGKWSNWSSVLSVKAFTKNVAATETVLPTGISFTNITDSKIELAKEKYYKVNTKIEPYNSTYRNIVWSSTNDKVAFVEDGLLRAKGYGTATITAKVSGTDVSSSFEVTVKNELVAISAYLYSQCVYPSVYYEYHYSTTPSDYTPMEKAKWTSSEPEVMEITEDGIGYERGSGITQLTVTMDGKSASVTYTKAPTSDYYSKEVHEDRSVTLKLKRLPGEKEYIIMDGDRTVAQITADGRKEYVVTDDYYKDSTATGVTYRIIWRFGDDTNTYRHQLSTSYSFGDKYLITYHLGEGTQNPDNPEFYISGNYYKLHDPEAPEGFTFDGWYLDEDYTQKASCIRVDYTGDLDLYAKYSSRKQMIWGDIDEQMQKELFEGDEKAVPQGLWYAFGNNKKGYGKRVFYGPSNTDLKAVYNGSAITFDGEINVFKGTERLLEGRDYTVSYKNNIAAAGHNGAKAPSIIINGIGIYQSTSTFTFDIEQAQLSDAELVSETHVALMAGKSSKLGSIRPVIEFAGKTLKEGKDYQLIYHEGSRDGAVVNNPGATVLPDPGKTYIIVATAMAGGNYTGEMLQTVSLTTADPAKSVSASKLKVTAANGKALKLTYTTGDRVDIQEAFDNSDGKTPIAVVKYKKKVLTYGVDYTVEEISGDFKSAGKHRFAINGIVKDSSAEPFYVGSKNADLEIKGTPMSKVKISGLPKSVDYSGESLSFEDISAEGGITLYHKDSKTKLTKVLTRSEDGINGDYTVSFANNGNAGKYTLELRGINGYSGAIKKTVKVKAYNIKKDAGQKIEINAEQAVLRNGRAYPVVTVTFKTEKGTVTLKEGVDYTLSYKNNKKIPTAGTKKLPTVVVKGKGNFTGQSSKTFVVIADE